MTKLLLLEKKKSSPVLPAPQLSPNRDDLSAPLVIRPPSAA